MTAKGRGFTYVELMASFAIVCILAGLSVTTYRTYVMRAELAQQIVAVGHIRYSIFLDARSGTKDDTTLADGAVPGKAPPRLAGPVTDAEFNGPDGLRMQLVYFPGALFASFPGGGYGLVVDSSLPDGLQRLRLFYQEVDRSGFAVAWLGDASFLIGLIDVAQVEPGPGSGSGSSGGGTNQGSGGTGGGTNQGSGGAATGGGPCPPGWSSQGNSGNCSSPNKGDPCPPGWDPVGNSGMCKASK